MSFAFSDLPVELIQQIIFHLDPESTLNLGKLDRYLNRLALGAFFGTTNGGTHLRQFPVFPEGWGAFFVATNRSSQCHLCQFPVFADFMCFREQLYRGLCIAFALDEITEFSERISRCFSQALQQIRKLKLCITGLRSLKVFKLRIDVRPPTARMGEEWINNRSWDEFSWEVQQLMDLVVARGCEQLHIDGKEAPPGPHCNLSASQVRFLLSKQSATTKVWRWTKSHIPCWGATNNSHSPSTESCGSNLKDITFTPVAFFGKTTPAFNLDLLQRNANSITRLELSISGVMSRSGTKIRGLTRGLLDNINLPKLETFIFHTPTWSIPGPTFAWFLSRHPTLNALTVDIEPNHLEKFTSRSPINLPNLQEIRLAPGMAAWFFKNLIQDPHIVQKISLGTYHRCAHYQSVGDTIRELRRRRKQLTHVSLSTDWWTYAMDLSHEKFKDRLGGPSDLPQLIVKKLVLVLDEQPYETYGIELAGFFIRLLKVVFSAEDLIIQTQGRCSKHTNLQCKYIVTTIQKAFTTLNVNGCNF